MEEEKKYFRADILKVKQKIFDSYPENSQVRKMMVKKEQLNELQSLSIAQSLYPKGQMEAISALVKLEMGDAGMRFVLGLFFLCMLFFAETLFPIPAGLGKISFFIILGGITFWMGFEVKRIISGAFALYKAKKSTEQLESRISQLKNDIFGDL